jgi:3-dehydroquinate synthetase/predicted NBD/HSP70 family sugar kinase
MNNQSWNSRRVSADRRSNYDICVVEGLLKNGADNLVDCLQGRSGLIVTTPTVAQLYGYELQDQLRRKGVILPLLVMNCRESTKNLGQVEQVCEAAWKHNIDRRSILVALGGGVCMDIVSFAASMIRRGIRSIRVPTTLIGQVDAAVGIKGGVNFRGKKSALGCFYAPSAVFVDRTFLQTLHEDHLRAGFSEILKIALVRDRTLYGLIEHAALQLIETRFEEPALEGQRILWKAIIGMIEELEGNIFENQTYRRRVDFGHTFSPLLEAKSEYELTHGEAVAVDMAFSVTLSYRLGFLSRVARDRILTLMTDLGLPVHSALLDETLVREALVAARAHRGGCVNLVLPVTIGSATFVENQELLKSAIVRAALQDLNSWERPIVAVQRRNSCLVFDVGGTKLRAALYHHSSEGISKALVEPTPSFLTLPGRSRTEIYRGLIAAMMRLGDKIVGPTDPSAIGIAFPGPIGCDGQVEAAPTLWGRMRGERKDLVSDVRAHWPAATVHLLNDVTAAGYRYLRGSRETFCVVTVSSGIGNKVFINGEPVVGSHGQGGEIGHARVDFTTDAPVCDCGGAGHLGAISSGRGTLLLARRLAKRSPDRFQKSLLGRSVDRDPDAITNEAIVSAFRAEDPWTIDTVSRGAAPLARALAILHSAMGIERFTIVGGFALALGEPYRQTLATAAQKSSWNMVQDWDSIVELGLDDDLSGLIGAGRFALGRIGGQRRIHHLRSVNAHIPQPQPLHSATQRLP